MKNVIDRFFALDKQLHTPKQAILLSTHLNTADEPNVPLAMTYEAMLHYLGWSNKGMIQAGALDWQGANDFPYRTIFHKILPFAEI